MGKRDHWFRNNNQILSKFELIYPKRTKAEENIEKRKEILFKYKLDENIRLCILNPLKNYLIGYHYN